MKDLGHERRPNDSEDATAPTTSLGDDLLLVFDALPDGVIVVGPDGLVEWSNPAATSLLGTDLVGNPFGLPVSNRNRHAEVDVIGADGQQRVVELKVTPFDRRDHRAYLVEVRDVTSRKAEVRALEKSEERYELAIKGANDGLWDWDIQHATLHVSARWHDILGVRRGDAEHDADYWFDRVHPDDVDDLSNDINEHLAGRALLLHNEHRLQREDDSYVWVLVRGMAVFKDGGAVRVAGSLTDITDRRRLEERLRHEAMHDPLTGLPNRRLFLDRLRQHVEQSRRHHAPFAVAVLDLDGFKAVNDTHGHEAGDVLLTTVARRLESSLRPDDTVARFGGDEFALLWSHVDDDATLRALATRVVDQIGRPVEVNDLSVRVSASIGVVRSSPDVDAFAYLRTADEAMFRAKRRGGGLSIA